MPRQTRALIDKTGSISSTSLRAVAAAVEIQAKRDLQPFWDHVDAKISVLSANAKIPTGVWPVYIGANLPGGLEGVHQDDKGVPYANVEMAAGEAWKLTVSHEVCEMLVDPTLTQAVYGPAIAVVQGQVHDAPGQFHYLVEVCDPSESADHGYVINGQPVSDFYTPHFFDAQPNPGTKYSYTGALKAPRRVLKGGYLSWRDPVKNIFQQLVWIDSDTPTIRTVDYTPPAGAQMSREHIDRHTGTSRLLSHTHKNHPLFLRAAKERGE